MKRQNIESIKAFLNAFIQDSGLYDDGKEDGDYYLNRLQETLDFVRSCSKEEFEDLQKSLLQNYER